MEHGEEASGTAIEGGAQSMEVTLSLAAALSGARKGQTDYFPVLSGQAVLLVRPQQLEPPSRRAGVLVCARTCGFSGSGGAAPDVAFWRRQRPSCVATVALMPLWGNDLWTPSSAPRFLRAGLTGSQVGDRMARATR